MCLRDLFPPLSGIHLQPALVCRPGAFDGAYVLAQLQTAGIPALISVYSTGWTRSLPFIDFVSQFRLWLRGRWTVQSTDTRRLHENVVAILATAVQHASGRQRLEASMWRVGSSRIYFKRDVLRLLETQLRKDQERAYMRAKRFLRRVCSNILSHRAREAKVCLFT